MTTTLQATVPGAHPARSRRQRTAARAAWASCTDHERADLLARCSGIAVARTITPMRDGFVPPGDANDTADVPGRCDQMLQDIAVHLGRRAEEHTHVGGLRTELVVDDGFPLDLATVHLGAALIGGEAVVLGLTRHVDVGALRYFRGLATLLPGGMLHVTLGERLVQGGTDRSVWLSPTCITDRSPVALGLASAIVSMAVSRGADDGTSDPAPPAVPRSS
ncbi:hypothetical protein EDF63_1833 [Curtobacterium sp. JUb34]|uniref:hypothetical protein n=1 Tax=Curtobacterium sp. JUb34 TaxID=2485109 RepID=UPI000F47E06C|nr:hypothetical protein [Curtobacterium sp. JUb34]ROR33420.1 hypothetical protein EDF63_1833 [Curtobacterium sp. JUb34]